MKKDVYTQRSLSKCPFKSFEYISIWHSVILRARAR